MSELLPLHIFPEGSLSSSVTTTVLIGVWVVAFFNLRFGWTLSALVVPGYVVPLLIVKPITVAVIAVEGVATYLVAHLLSEHVRLRGNWSSLFGRDRFFLIVLVSVAVRLVFDGWLLPRVGAWLPAWRVDLHSFGLVVVPLIANYLWKPGLCRGVLHLQTLVWVTYLMTRYVVIPCTNFRMSGLFYMYEDSVGSMLSSPKSYILLISTAYLASRVNVRYGWEYSGILIPALLALEWNAPQKIVASFVEAGVILVGAKFILATPLLKRITVEGARKLVLFFSVAYGWRLLLGFFLNSWRPDWQVSDVYGFGYLLSTLLAIKAYDREATIRIASATLRLCGVGAALGTAVGLGLTFAPAAPEFLVAAAAPPATGRSPEELRVDLLTQLQADKLRLYAAALPGREQLPTEAELNAFDLGLQALLQPNSAGAGDSVERGAGWLDSAGMEVGTIGSRYRYVRDAFPAQGRGLYVIDPESTSELVIAVPYPLQVPDSLAAGLALFQRLEARALLIDADAPPGVGSAAQDAAAYPRTCFAHATHLVSGGNLLIVGGPTTSQPVSDRLWVKRQPPNDLEVRRLLSCVPGLSASWEPPPAAGPLWESFWHQIAWLQLTPESLRWIAVEETATDAGNALQRLEQPVHRWLLEQQEQIAPEGSAAYRPAALEEMLLLDHEVVTPLLRIAREASTLDSIGTHDLLGLEQAARAAESLELQLASLTDRSTGQEFLVLSDAPDRPGRHWGTFMFRIGAELPAILEVSRPLAELRTLETGITLFEATRSRGLLIPGAHLRANPDGSSDLLQFNNKVSLLHLFRQALLRESGESPLLFLQVRGARFQFAAQAVLSPAELVLADSELPPVTRQLHETLRDHLGVDCILNGTRPEASGFTISSMYAHMMRSQPASREVASLWMSEELRQAFRQASDVSLIEDQFRALGIPIRETGLVEYLTIENQETASPKPAAFPEPEQRQQLMSSLAEYVSRQDVLLLRRLQHAYAEWQWVFLREPRSGQLFLVLSAPGGGYRLVANLAPGAREVPPIQIESASPEQVRAFRQRRARWLEIGRQP